MSHEMVDIKLSGRNDDSSTEDVELSALHWITANDKDAKGGLLGPAILAADALHTYIITPHHNQGSLLDYCAESGRLREAEARFIFRQMLQVRIDVMNTYCLIRSFQGRLLYIVDCVNICKGTGNAQTA
jgi:hypothetical protein